MIPSFFAPFAPLRETELISLRQGAKKTSQGYTEK